MPTVQDFFRLKIYVDSNPKTADHYALPLLLVDHSDVPIYQRVREVSPATFATRLTADSEAYNWFSRFYEQNYPTDPANASDNIVGYVGRWASSSTAPVRIFPNAESDSSVYAALTNTAGFNIDDGSNDEDVVPDFTGDTDMDDVAASITTALAAGTNFTNHVCSVDVLGNLILTGGTPGASANEFVISAPASGTDLSGVLYLGAATSWSHAGLDAETLAAAAAAVFNKNNNGVVVFERGANDTQKLAFLTAMDAAYDDKFCVVVTDDEDQEDSEAFSSSLGYQAKALEFDKCHIIYSRQDDYPDAAGYGECLPQDEGSVDLALTPFKNISSSALAADGVTAIEVEESTAGAIEALDSIKTDFVTKPLNEVHFARGLCPNGDEVRIQLCRMWAEHNASLEGYQLLLSNKVSTFSDGFLMQIKTIVQRYMDACVDRKAIEQGYELNIPSAAEFTAVQKASHAMSIQDIVLAGIQFAVNSVFLSSTWSAR
jgi:hypothetical protein